MNFKFPSSLDNPPPNPNFNVNPNISYFTQQAIRAGCIANDVGRREIDGFTTTGDLSRREFDGFTTTGDVSRRQFDFSQNSVNIRGSMQREIEKDRIRAEIIAEEKMRRRILEEEVRREMIRDRELGFRHGKPEFGIGGSVGSMRVEQRRVPLLTNFEIRDGVGGAGALSYRDVKYGVGFHTMSFNRDGVVAGSGSGSGNGVTLHEMKEVSKDKTIILAKPSSNLVDLKRKTMAPPVGGAMEVFKKHKTKEGWSCALCQITATSEQGLNEHLQGKKHQAREGGMVSHRTGFATGPLPKSLSTNTVKPLTLLSIPSTHSLMNDGKPGGGSSLAKVNNSSAKNVNHTLLKLKRTSLGKKGNGKAKATATGKRGKAKKKFQYFCEMCQIGANSTTVFDAHKKGKKHLAKLSVLNKTDETAQVEASAQKDLTDENKGEAKAPVIGKRGKPEKKFRYFCEMCQIGANSVIVFDTHQKGKKHLANVSLLNKTEKAVTEENKELAAVET